MPHPCSQLSASALKAIVDLRRRSCLPWKMWGHGPVSIVQRPPTEEEQALEAAMEDIFRDDEGVAPQSIAEDEDPKPSGLDILGALADVPPRPTPWGPLFQSYALNDGPPPNRPFLYFKKLREAVVDAGANVPHADPIFTEMQLDVWFSEPLFNARDWHPPYFPMAVPHAIGYS